MSDRIQAFLTQYESAIAQSDVTAIAARYADVFMFAGPAGVQSVKKEDFLRVVPKRKEWFASLGLVDSKVTLVDETSLDSKYSLVKTAWSMSFEKTRGVTRALETSATYILEWNEGTAKIVFQIDHQDLTRAVKELKLE
jgi:ketosteroid isomerase-like protein